MFRRELSEEHHCHDHSLPLAPATLPNAARKHLFRKGDVYTSNAPDQRAVLQVVGRRVDISLQEVWGERVPRTQIVAIGAAGSIDAKLLDDMPRFTQPVIIEDLSTPANSLGVR